MDTNGTFEQNDTAPGLILTKQAQNYLRESGKWACFLGTIGFIGTGFILIAAFFMAEIFSFIFRYQRGAIPVDVNIIAIVSFINVLLAVFYFLFSLYLFQFGKKIQKGIFLADQAVVSRAFRKLKSFFRLWGIASIITIAFYTIAIIVTLIVLSGATKLFQK